MLKNQEKNKMVRKLINDGKGGGGKYYNPTVDIGKGASTITAGATGIPIVGLAASVGMHQINKASEKANKEIEGLGKQSSDQADSILKSLRARSVKKNKITTGNRNRNRMA